MSGPAGQLREPAAAVHHRVFEQARVGQQKAVVCTHASISHAIGLARPTYKYAVLAST